MVYKILVTEPEYFDDKAISSLYTVGSVKKIRLNNNEILNVISDYDAIIIRVETTLNSKVLKRAKNLKVIGSATTGIEHIDTKYTQAHHIPVFHLHGTHTIPTAEHTFALLLSLTRKIPWAFDSVKNGKWERYKFIGNNLNGKQLGIVGLGRIGQQVAKIATAFGMRVAYSDPNQKNIKLNRLSLNELMRTSDIISVHASLNQSSINLIDDTMLKLMKKDALLINTSRAAIVDYKSLVNRLKKGYIKGAAIDVYSKEPVDNSSAYLISYARAHQNLILTPHLGASTKETAFNAAKEISKSIAVYLTSLSTNKKSIR